MKKTISSLFILAAINSTYAQFESTDIGARASGLNGAFTSVSDNSLAIFYNPSGSGQMKYREVSVFYNPSPFGVSEVSTLALTYAEPLKFGTFGLGIKSFGYELYRESNVILSYGNSFTDKIFLGFNLNYYYLNIKNYNTASSFGADIGAMAYISGTLKWGFFAKNITGATIGKSGEKLAQVYRTGFTAKPREDLNLILEAEKDVRYPLSVKAGLEYFVNEYIDLRAGVGTEPAAFSGGLSLNYNLFQLDYSIYSNGELGITNQGSLTINFGGNKAKKNSMTMLKKAFAD